MRTVEVSAKIIIKRLIGIPKPPIKGMQMLKLVWVGCMPKVEACAKTIIKRLSGTPKPPIKVTQGLKLIWG